MTGVGTRMAATNTYDQDYQLTGINTGASAIQNLTNAFDPRKPILTKHYTDDRVERGLQLHEEYADRRRAPGLRGLPGD